MKVHSLTTRAFGPITLMLFTATQAQAQETESTSLLGLLQQGGWAMFPLGLTALFMFFLIFFICPSMSNIFVNFPDYPPSFPLFPYN